MESDSTLSWRAHRDAVAMFDRMKEEEVHYVGSGKRYYIAGPMSKYREENYNFATFYKAEALLELAGHTVANPARADIEEGRARYVPAEGRIVLSPDFTLAHVLRRDYAMLAQCDGIVLLPGWEDSVGANKELRTAREDFQMPAYILRQDVTGWPVLEELK